MTTNEVIGRNGYRYDARHLSGNLYVVGKYVVIVEGGYCQDTVCRATKRNLEAIARRNQLVG